MEMDERTIRFRSPMKKMKQKVFITVDLQSLVLLAAGFAHHSIGLMRLNLRPAVGLLGARTFLFFSKTQVRIFLKQNNRQKKATLQIIIKLYLHNLIRSMAWYTRIIQHHRPWNQGERETSWI